MRGIVALSFIVFPLLACGSQPAQKAIPTHIVQVSTTPPSWPFSETILPPPPFQGNPRNDIPRAGLPQGFVKAMERLLAQGFADPRSLPYHEVEITLTTKPEEPRRRVAVQAFVLPNQINGHAFGIAWNGLVYPLESVGKVANVSADVHSLLQHDRELCARFRDIVPDGACLRSRSPRAEIHSLLLEEILPSHIGLLWARGEIEFATTLWQTWILGGMPEDTPEISLEERDIYGRLASHFRYVVEDRAFWAHVRGDDAIALANLRGAAKIKNEIAMSAKVLGISEETWSSPPSIDLLLADQEKRARRNDRATTQFPDKLPMNQNERIKFLVDLLDEVNEPVFARYGQEKRVLDDKILHALVAEGQPAIVPLANALETDTRMTRSVWYQPHGIKLFSVADVAEIALLEMMKDSPAPPLHSDMSRKEKAKRFREAASMIPANH